MLIIFQSTVFAIEKCSLSNDNKTERAKVKWVYDGDTLKLSDDRKIRIIGIDTPETKHHKQKAQAFGAKAREALRALLKDVNYNVKLRYDSTKRDKYGRTLAHVFLPNGSNVSEWLLAQGFAKTLIIPPNLRYLSCYKKAEKEAQKNSLNIWSLNANKLQESTQLKKKTKGFVRLKGQITAINKKRKSIVLKLKANKKRPIHIKISKRHWRYFKKTDPAKLLNQHIIVSGMLKKKRGKRIIQINHPTQLERVSNKPENSSKKIKPTIEWSTQQ